MSTMRPRDVAHIEGHSVTNPVMEHGAFAELSHMAALAARRLQPGRVPSSEDVKNILMILRGIENLGLVSFLRRHGTEEDYKAVGESVTRRYAGPVRRQ
ncbi:MAG TPA: hypothetical protein VL752_15275 [Acidisoma sp.]|jgi:hypothetical protein|uniref:hypothetical protein n=1 Tax=Acidisoma sp. TaxID=1872115 RepID=UPI002CB2B974|nr:hypothetical protein [Acidisoma sp.]HTI02311.1 hypothetical protein [Acidisoma sp.]